MTVTYGSCPTCGQRWPTEPETTPTADHDAPFDMRPMDEAPKDGREIVIFTDEVITAFWQDGWQRITCYNPYTYWPCDPARHGLNPARFRGWADA